MKLRNQLDDFMSIVCFKAAIRGMEDILGEEGTAAALISAGRQRGRDVAEALDMVNANPEVTQLAPALDGAFGLQGTKLCHIAEVTQTDNGFLVKAQDTVCMSGEPEGTSRRCTYTLGAIVGFFEAAYGKSYMAKHVAQTTAGAETEEFLIESIT